MLTVTSLGKVVLQMTDESGYLRKDIETMLKTKKMNVSTCLCIPTKELPEVHFSWSVNQKQFSLPFQCFKKYTPEDILQSKLQLSYDDLPSYFFCSTIHKPSPDSEMFCFILCVFQTKTC